MNNKSQKLFTPSGCLTGDALMLFVNSALKGSKLTQVQQHVTECVLCTDAAEGLRMWLNNNKSVDNISPELTGNPANEVHELAGNFDTLTGAINEKIRQRLLTHVVNKTSEKAPLSYKPFVWLAAAATIILFISGGYILWIQNQTESNKLAQKPEIDFLTQAFGTTGYDALPFPPSQNTSVLTIKYSRKKRDKAPPVLAIVMEDVQMVKSKNESSASAEDHVEYTKSKRSQTSEVKEDDYIESYNTREHPTSVARKGGAAMKNEEPEDDSGSLYAFVNEMPSFPGGEAKRKKFLTKNLRYPQQAYENDIQGNVYVGFIVKKDGSLANVKILHGIGGGCDEEALRVLKMMPPWKPGYLNGKKVDVLFTMPIYFKLR